MNESEKKTLPEKYNSERPVPVLYPWLIITVL